ncbi:serine/threonine/dual specificity protein kinase, catalytic domain-containing protein [Artemisia annua]|uniref:Serine/threonine/dual specificity protein kinase, catalytic domain-containing protein n=1 Tax=Artemisia annua TaxID=35608 RepID=A0A2U1LLU6_ARTAN|nr:serine/threonine/dual specificity protein kinase, catalytic domain-containing protein [Artemisia annua]
MVPFKYPFYNATDTQCDGLIKVNCSSNLNYTEIQLGKQSYRIGKIDYESSLYIYNYTFEELRKNESCDALMDNFTSPEPFRYSIAISPFITLFKCAKNVTYFDQPEYNSHNRCKYHNFYYQYLISNSTIPSDLPHSCQDEWRRRVAYSKILIVLVNVEKNYPTMPTFPESFSCPNMVPFKYPFYNGTNTQCGLIKVNCYSNSAEIQLGNQSYRIGKIDYESSLAIYNHTFAELVNNESCDALMNNFTSPEPLLYSISIAPFITLFKCAKNVTYFDQPKYNSHNRCNDYNFYYQYMINNAAIPSDIPHSCQGSQCHLHDGNYQCLDAKKEEARKLPWVKLLLALSVGVVIILISILLCIKRKFGWRKKAEYNAHVETFLKNQAFMAPKRYSYSQIKKMTNTFKVKLGQGGFGSMYRGELSNGNLVAVKVCSQLKGDGKNFVNEVASVGRTCHVNIVSLVGLCLKGRQRALIYKLCPMDLLRSSYMVVVLQGRPGILLLNYFPEVLEWRENIEVEVDNTSEIYFPHWIYKKVESHEEQLGLHGIGSDDVNEMVLEMLEDDLASIEIPPKPYMSSPSSIPLIHSSTPTCPESFSCPHMVPFKYPYYNGTDTRCGLIKVNCYSNNSEIQLGNKSYTIGKIDYESTLNIYNNTFAELVNTTSCEALMNNFTSPEPLLYSISIAPFITLFKCAKNVTYFEQPKYNSHKRCNDYNFYYQYMINNATIPSDIPHSCQVIQLPVVQQYQFDNEGRDQTKIFSLLYPYFSISFKFCPRCHNKGSQCHPHNGNYQCLDAKKGMYTLYIPIPHT